MQTRPLEGAVEENITADPVQATVSLLDSRQSIGFKMCVADPY